MDFDLAIIGGGPGGYTAAEEAAALGQRVVLFEQDLIGGTCLNRGCIPTKALIHAADAYAGALEAEKLGVLADGVSYDFAAMHAHADEVVATLRSGIERAMKAGHVEVVHARARVDAAGAEGCRVSADGRVFNVRDVIVATGSKPKRLPIPGADGAGVVTSDEILSGEVGDVSSLAIIGGGVIGVECAQILSSLGCAVTIIEALPQILPPFDREVAQRVTMALKRRGVTISCGCSVGEISGEPGEKVVRYTDAKGAEHDTRAERVLVAVGRGAVTDGVFSAEATPELARGAIVTAADGSTSLPHVYAVGDVRAGTTQLAHVAAAQGRNVVARVAGRPAPVDEGLIPSCVYTSPEVASVGSTEAEAKAAGRDVVSAKLTSGSNGRALIEGGTPGYVKLIADAADLRIIGAQLVCPRATDLIAEVALAMHLGATATDLAATIHAHPTVSELIYEAARKLTTAGGTA